MKKNLKFVRDEPIDFNDEGDLLNFNKFVERLEDIIISHEENYSINIALFGKWGSGKSSIIKTLKNKIENEYSSIKFIEFDAWKYSGNSFKRSFINEINKSLGNKSELSDDNNLYSSRSYKSKSFMEWLFIFISFSISFSILIIFYFYNEEWVRIIGIISYIVSIIGFFSIEERINVEKTFATEQFELKFKNLISKNTKEYPEDNTKQRKEKHPIKNLSHKIRSLLHKISRVRGKNYEKWVIVIDNIDRCTSSEILDRLSELKTFLTIDKNVIFLIPLDEDFLKIALEKEIYGINKYKKTNLFLEYVGKIFDIVIRIDEPNFRKIKEFAFQMDLQNGLGLDLDTLSLIDETFVSDPRRIKQFINNLIIELNRYDDEFLEKNEYTISLLFLIKEEFPNIFKNLLNNHDNIELLIQDSKTTCNKWGIPEKEKQKFLDFIKLKPFKNISTIDNVYNRILSMSDKSNSSNSSFLPPDINEILFKDEEEIKNNHVDIKRYINKNNQNKKAFLFKIYTNIEDCFERGGHRTLNNHICILIDLQDEFNLVSLPPKIAYILSEKIDFSFIKKYQENPETLIGFCSKIKDQDLIKNILDEFIRDRIDENKYNIDENNLYDYLVSIIKIDSKKYVSKISRIVGKNIELLQLDEDKILISNISSGHIINKLCSNLNINFEKFMVYIMKFNPDLISSDYVVKILHQILKDLQKEEKLLSKHKIENDDNKIMGILHEFFSLFNFKEKELETETSESIRRIIKILEENYVNEDNSDCYNKLLNLI